MVAFAFRLQEISVLVPALPIKGKDWNGTHASSQMSNSLCRSWTTPSLTVTSTYAPSRISLRTSALTVTVRFAPGTGGSGLTTISRICLKMISDLQASLDSPMILRVEFKYGGAESEDYAPMKRMEGQPLTLHPLLHHSPSNSTCRLLSPCHPP